MRSFVVDASVAIKWFVPKEQTVESRLLLDENFELFAPHLLFTEYGNIVWKNFTRGELIVRKSLIASTRYCRSDFESRRSVCCSATPSSWPAIRSIRPTTVSTLRWRTCSEPPS